MSAQSLVRTARIVRWQIALPLVLVAAAIGFQIWRTSSRDRASSPPGERKITVTLPTFEEALTTPKKVADVCTALEQPAPPAFAQMEREAAQAIYNAIIAVCNTPNLAETWGRLGMVYHSHELLPQADAAYKRARGLDPNDYRWAYYSAYTAFERDDKQAAIDGFNKTLELNASYTPCYLNLGKLYYDKDDYAAAEAAYAEYAHRRPADPLGYVGLGEVASKRGQFPEAIKHMTEALKYPPEDSRAYYVLGIAHRELGDEEKARAFLQRSRETPLHVQIDDPLWSQKNALSTTVAAGQQELVKAMVSGELDRAIEIGERLAARAPDSYGVLANLAEAYRRARRLDDAANTAQKAIQLEPDSAHGYMLLGQIELDRQAWDQAKSALDRSVGLDADNAFAWLLRAKVYTQRQAFDEAVRSASRATDIDPENPVGWQMRAMLSDLIGDRAATIAALERYLELKPDDQPARDKLQQLRSGRPPGRPDAQTQARRTTTATAPGNAPSPPESGPASSPPNRPAHTAASP